MKLRSSSLVFALFVSHGISSAIATPYLIEDSVDRGFDWHETWIGLVYTNAWPWAFHAELGWLYSGTDGNSNEGGWYYAANDPLKGWFWTARSADRWFYGKPHNHDFAWWHLTRNAGTEESHYELISQAGDRIGSEDAWVRPQTPILPRTHTYHHPIAPRLQWNANSGYCGETSFISAGLHFGQYCSQYTARAVTSPDKKQTDPNSQLLLGVNDTTAALRMRLQAIEYYYPTQTSSEDFLAWVKSNTLQGHVVIVGVFNNGILLGEWSGRDQGDDEYDHIVPVLGIGSAVPFEPHAGEYLASDTLTLSDNGLYGPLGNPPAHQFLYSSRFDLFLGDRYQANNPRGPVYLLKDQPRNYGIAIQGVLDFDQVTIPVRLHSSLNHEPDMAHNSDVPPAPVPLTLTATVSIPDQTRSYHLYLYDDFRQVPVQNFNAGASQAVDMWVIPPHSGETYTVLLETLSNQTVIFRAVPADAP